MATDGSFKKMEGTFSAQDPKAVNSAENANLLIALLENYSHARLIALCFARWTGRPSAAERKMGTNAITSPAGSTTLPMPFEVRGHGKVWGRRQSRWLRTADGFAVLSRRSIQN
jgi:hypothetical protein